MPANAPAGDMNHLALGPLDSLATAVDPAAVLRTFGSKMNFEMMPGNSTAMAMASLFTAN